MKKFFTTGLFIVLSIISYAQNASDYFPATPGYKWFYSITPYDSLQNLVDSLSQAKVDSFTGIVTYEGKEAKEVLSKLGPKEVVLNIPFSDTSHVNLDGSNISLFIEGLPIELDSLGGFLNGIKGWYSTYRLASPVNTTYTIFTKDTNITYNGVGLIMTIEVKGKRLADQTLNTALGTFLCKKFILTPAVKAKLAALPIFSYTLLTMNDTVYIAPGNFVVLDNTPSAKVDLSLLALPSFWIPGTKIEILPPPGILSVSPLLINVPAVAGDTVALIENTGPGTLKWKARILTGGEWLSITSDTSGINNDTLALHYVENNSPGVRTATIMVWDDSSFSPRQLITVTQNQPSGIETAHIKKVGFNLFENYPNPFNPSTTIRFSLEERSFVSLKIYNALGKEIAVLLNGMKDSGIHQLQFDGTGLPSSIYFYKLNAGTYSSVKKMILMK